jgi:prepilin-type N-terminal cleavage/methylation domain-containing protein
MKRWNDKGFSLVEVMVAMSISTIVVMGGMAALQVSARLVQQGTIKTRALALAQGRLEAKRSVPSTRPAVDFEAAAGSLRRNRLNRLRGIERRENVLEFIHRFGIISRWASRLPKHRRDTEQEQKKEEEWQHRSNL